VLQQRDGRLIELRIQGIDCTEWAQQLERSPCRLPGVSSAQVLPAAGKALIQVQPRVVDMEAVERTASVIKATIGVHGHDRDVLHCDR
jgi:cation transport ATPase